MVNLRLVLKVLNNQIDKWFEIIVSEDDNNEETITFIQQNKERYIFPIVHLYQKADLGFRKNAMLNKSIVKAQASKIAFIDGDCIPHKRFVNQYIKNINEATFCSGRAVMLSKEITHTILGSEDLKKLQISSLVKSGSKKVKDGIYSPLFPLSLRVPGLVGRNWRLVRKHC